MNIMEKSMKTMDTSKNTMEKIMKPVDKLMIMRDCSYKMQQINNFSCKNRGREPGRLKNTKCKNKQFNSAPNEKWANCSDLGVFKSGKSSQNCTRFMRVCYNLPSVMLKVYKNKDSGIFVAKPECCLTSPQQWLKLVSPSLVSQLLVRLLLRACIPCQPLGSCWWLGWTQRAMAIQ